MILPLTLPKYDLAFDFYLEWGKMPDYISDGDVIGKYIIQTIHNNPQLYNSDKLWKEVLKDELMKFIEVMLQLLHQIEEEYLSEMKLIADFQNGTLEQKRQLWPKVHYTLKNLYQPTEVYLKGYIQMMKRQDRDIVISAMARDWRKACDARVMRLMEATIENNKGRFENQVWEHGLSDYKHRQQLNYTLCKYPALEEIVRIIGREKPENDEEYDETIKRYLPILPSPPKPAVEVEEVALGNDLRHVVPMEIAILSDHNTEDVFYVKYATRKLQLFANKPKEEARWKTELEHKTKPRLEKGPIIVSLDTSGSMEGRPIKLANSLLMSLLHMARKQHRNCYLITFSVRSQCLDLSHPSAWSRLESFLQSGYSGGTSGEQMLKDSIKMLQTSTFGMADVLIISDFEFPEPLKATRDKMQEEHEKGTRFYGLQIGRHKSIYNKILDKFWRI